MHTNTGVPGARISASVRRAAAVGGEPMAFFTCDVLEPSYAEIGRAERWGVGAARSYGDLFALEGWDSTMIKFPEAYPNPNFLPPQETKAPGEEALPIHFSFRGVGTLNLIKGAYNIYACPWRYPTISEHFSYNTIIQRNMRHMLGLPQEVWASSEYAAEVFRRAGVENVYAMPAPVPQLTPARDVRRTLEGFTMCFNGFNGEPAEKLKLDEFLKAQSETVSRKPKGKGGRGRKRVKADAASAETEPTVFVTIVDPADPCANFEQLVRGFMLATGKTENAVLIAVLAVSAERRAELKAPDIGYRLAEQHFRADADLISDKILLVPDRLSSARMGALMELADYYLCASSAEDQNMPLMIGMAHGAVPVSTRVTAMGDYLTDENSLDVETESMAIESGGLAISAAAESFAAQAPTARMVALAVRRAMGVSKEKRGALSAEARRTIDAHYGLEAAGRRIRARLEAIGAARSPETENADVVEAVDLAAAQPVGFDLTPTPLDVS